MTDEMLWTLAERERCARIAEEVAEAGDDASVYCTDDLTRKIAKGLVEAIQQTAKEIARRIRENK
jgi:hypothetical protein